jgi:predicted RNase H-like nuclease (RuvC/YqgF family)
MRIAIGAAVALALAVLCYYAWPESISQDGARIQELEQQVAELKAQLAATQGHPARAPLDQSHSTAHEPRPPVVSPDGQNERMQELMSAVERFERTASELNDRITRSKLNIPTREELSVQIEKARAELDKVRNSSRQKQAVVRQIAASLNVQLGMDALLEPGASSVLEANPSFVSARSAALEEKKLQMDIEQRYTDLRFQMVIEAKPIKRNH